MLGKEFLPVCRADMEARGWDRPDFVYVTGDAYVDHPSFGVAIISRVLEAAGYRVAVLAQPDWKSADAFREYGRPRLGFLVTAGNIDSMVAHYSVSRHRRNYDYYSPGGEIGHRPDRACIVYSNRIREAYGDVPIVLGGLEASLRRFAHYDYWDDKIRRSLLIDSRADILTYGMGEKIIVRIADLLAKGVPVKKIRDVRGSCYICRADAPEVHFPVAAEFDWDVIKNGARPYAEAFAAQYREQDAISGRAIIERYGDKLLVQNPPMPPLEREELDRVYALPYTRRVHPIYDKQGGVPAIAEVAFSITQNRGCFGACNFCALAFHQGRTVRSRSIESCVEEAKIITSMDGFKGYIHDVGGPTANFREPACAKQLKSGVCPNKRCLAPRPCPNLRVDHSDYIKLLKAVEAVDGVKKVFVRSGVRFDYLMLDEDDAFFRKLVRDNVSGQLKVAPEHCSAGVLNAMGKPDFSVYKKFKKKFFEITAECGKEQYLVPYLMSAHPGSTLNDAVDLALYLKREGLNPEQVQDFYPTPGTASTVMFATGIDPFTMKEIFVAKTPQEKRMQRALLQFSRPENATTVREALRLAGREDLIGNGRECLVRPENSYRKNVSAKCRNAPKERTSRRSEADNGRNKRPGTSSKYAASAKPTAYGQNSQIKNSDNKKKSKNTPVSHDMKKASSPRGSFDKKSGRK